VKDTNDQNTLAVNFIIDGVGSVLMTSIAFPYVIDAFSWSEIPCKKIKGFNEKITIWSHLVNSELPDCILAMLAIWPSAGF